MNHYPRMRTVAASLFLVAMFALSACSAYRPAGTESVRTTPGATAGEQTWRFVTNRVFDFTDVFQFGVGLNTGFGAGMPTERDHEGKRDVEYGQVGHRTPGGSTSVPAETMGGSLLSIGSYVGAFVQCTDYMRLGRLWFAGHLAEWDGRGFYAGPERRTRTGLFVWEMLHIEQFYDVGWENYFKKNTTLWASRMNSESMRWRATPAKELNYTHWADTHHLGIPPLHRGWQHWANIAAEVDALIFYARVGFDPSEAVDFALGLIGIDYKHDDLKLEEYRERRDLGRGKRFLHQPKPPVDMQF